jgi:hypothetical protein
MRTVMVRYEATVPNQLGRSVVVLLLSPLLFTTIKSPSPRGRILVDSRGNLRATTTGITGG